MGTFSNFIGGYDSFEESVLPDIDADSLLEDTTIEECFEDNFIVAGARICAENTANMNAIMNACAIQEFCYYEQTGEELVYTEATGDSLIEKIKSYFLKLWEKIQSIFKKAIMMFNSKAQSDRDFYNKYKKEINDASSKGYGDKEVPFYDYVFYENAAKDHYKAYFTSKINVSDITTAKEKVFEKAGVASDKDKLLASSGIGTDGKDTTLQANKEADEVLKKIHESDWKNDYYDELRQDLVNAIKSGSVTGGVTSKEFSQEIATACQGGDDTKDNVNLSTAISKAAPYLYNSKDIVKGLDEGLKDWKREIDKIVKSLNNKKKELDKERVATGTDGDKAKENYYQASVLSTAVEVLKEAKNIGITYHSNLIQQQKNASSQAKSICVQAVHYKKPKNESAVFENESTSLLDTVDLI